MSKYIVITSIHGVTDSILKYAQMAHWHVILVGDRKTPRLDRHPHPNITFLSIDEQAELGFSLYGCCPFDHYARKNLGYLYAIRQGAELIADADDDNMPYAEWEQMATLDMPEMDVIAGSRYANVYRYFTDDFVWPRGYPLSSILDGSGVRVAFGSRVNVAVLQGLVDGDPDVDAIYRLTVGKPVSWRKRRPVALDKGTFCPINSQNTIWSKTMFPYLYLPSAVTFRFTDILRGYVAQAGAWSIDARVAYTSPSVFQTRNLHDLTADFIDEIPCYTMAERLTEILTDNRATGNSERDLLTIYTLLREHAVVGADELDAVRAWVRDVGELGWSGME